MVQVVQVIDRRNTLRYPGPLARRRRFAVNPDGRLQPNLEFQGSIEHWMRAPTLPIGGGKPKLLQRSE